MVIYLTLKFAFESLGGLEIEFAAFIILDFILIGWLWTFHCPQLKKRSPIRGIDPQTFRLLDESSTSELLGLDVKSMIEKNCGHIH